MLKKIFTDGVFTGILNTLAVAETDPVALAVRVNSGEAWIQGFWYQNTAYLTKSLAAADVTNPRIDRIVLRLDTVTNFKISIEVLTGVAAAVPEAPALTQTASTYEISLAQVSVLANATSVNNAKITDERTYAAVSGVEVTLTNTATLTNKTLTSPLFTGTIDGWISTGTFTYNAANKITVASGATSIYQKGDKLRYQNNDSGTWLYDYIITVADTLLTVMGDTVPNATLTDAYYSHVENPLGFPHWFAVTAPVFTVATYDNGAGGQPTTTECRFTIKGRLCIVHYRGQGTKAGTNASITMDSNSFPTIVNTSSITPLGMVSINAAPVIFGIISNNSFEIYLSANITDNVTISHFGFTMTYEI